MFTTDAERACEVVTYSWGSHNTQAHTIAWILKYITRDTSEQTKLREDLLAIPNPQDRHQQSKVLINVLQEGLRIAPVASVFSFRQTGRDFINPADKSMVVPKGSICMMALTVAHHDKTVWGEDALDFCAERWNSPTEMQKDAYTSFNLGSRNCPWQKLAKSQLLSMMAHMFANYEFELAQEGTSNFFGTYKPKDLLVKVHLIAK